jgi:hypothetical protein
MLAAKEVGFEFVIICPRNESITMPQVPLKPFECII